MFDGGFHSLGSFTDPNVPVQYPVHTAWQVEEINGQLWVTFASHRPGPYGGVVDIFDTDGHLLTPNHFAANAPGGPLENPWGIVQAPDDFGPFRNDILIGNVEGAGFVRLWDMTEAPPRVRILPKWHSSWARSVAFSPDGKV